MQVLVSLLPGEILPWTLTTLFTLCLHIVETRLTCYLRKLRAGKIVSVLNHTLLYVPITYFHSYTAIADIPGKTSVYIISGILYFLRKQAKKNLTGSELKVG